MGCSNSNNLGNQPKKVLKEPLEAMDIVGSNIPRKKGESESKLSKEELIKNIYNIKPYKTPKHNGDKPKLDDNIRNNNTYKKTKRPNIRLVGKNLNSPTRNQLLNAPGEKEKLTALSTYHSTLHGKILKKYESKGFINDDDYNNDNDDNDSETDCCNEQPNAFYNFGAYVEDKVILVNNRYHFKTNSGKSSSKI